MTHTKPPHADGLYDPRFEHDACGVAMVARLDNRPSHEVVQRALEALDNLEHRGAEGADVCTGDGAGILVQLPDAFFRGVAEVELPDRGQYGVGVCFLPHDPTHREQIEQLVVFRRSESRPPLTTARSRKATADCGSRRWGHRR